MKQAELILEEDVIYVPLRFRLKGKLQMCADRTKRFYTRELPPEGERKDRGQRRL